MNLLRTVVVFLDHIAVAIRDVFFGAVKLADRNVAMCAAPDILISINLRRRCSASNLNLDDVCMLERWKVLLDILQIDHVL